MLFSPRFFVRSDELFLTTKKKNKYVEIVEDRWLSFISC
nr:MAG TPA: hypothetical protein [Caudoviricetes sp.]